MGDIDNGNDIENDEANRNDIDIGNDIDIDNGNNIDVDNANDVGNDNDNDNDNDNVNRDGYFYCANIVSAGVQVQCNKCDCYYWICHCSQCVDKPQRYRCAVKNCEQ